MKKYLLAAVITAFAYAQIAFSADINEPEYLIFIGNPGVGKSTLINSLVGRHVAAAGVNPGVGLTKFFSAYEHNGKYYMDTPGLADMELREQAAREIESALKKDGKYRIFFMINLSAGRVMPEDVTTINTVMESIKSRDVGFNIIVNKLSTKEKNMILGDAVKMASVFEQLNSGNHKTDINNITYISVDREMEDDLTEFIKIAPSLSQFIYKNSKSFYIAKQDVQKIETDQYEQIKAEHQKNMKALQDEIKSGNEKYQDLFSRMATLQTQLDQAQKDAADAKKKADEKPATQTITVEKEVVKEVSTCFLF